MLAYQTDYNASVIADGLPFNSEAGEYLDKVFKDCVTRALEELLRERPENPIPYLASRIRENKRLADLKVEQQIKEQKLAEAAQKGGHRRRRHSQTTNVSSTYGASYTTVEKAPSDEEREEERNPHVQQTANGYALKFSGGLECNVNNVRSAPVKLIQGINVGKIISPTLYDLDSTLRVMEASAVPNETMGKPTPTLLIVEPPKAPEQVVFFKGIPYIFNLIQPLQTEIRNRNKEVSSLLKGESFENAALRLLKSHWNEDLVLLEDSIKDFVAKKNADGSDIHLAFLPSVQTNYFETYDHIDAVFFEVMHPETSESIRKGKHYASVASAANIPYFEPPTVLFVSYHSPSANLTFSRVLEPFFPYYIRYNNIKMDRLREVYKKKKGDLNYKFCVNYWATVHANRSKRDKDRKGITKDRLERREREDYQYMEVKKAHWNESATRIQKLFRGYMVRKDMKPSILAKVSTQTLFDDPLPVSIPPLMRLCLAKVSQVHGELFGNYPSSLFPEPQRVVLHKPVRKHIKSDGDETDAEDWEAEVIYIPPKRISQRVCHFNPLQRLMEYHRLADCSVLDTAIKIQKQCGGLSLLQRKAYDWLKSISLSLFHIAYLELFHRDILPFEAMRFSSFMKNFHGEVCGWFSYPHMFSQSNLMADYRTNRLSLSSTVKSIKTLGRIEDFIHSTQQKERLLILGSGVDYVSSNSDMSIEELLVHMDIKCLGRNMYAIPRLLSEAEWRVALKVIKDAAALPLAQFSVEDPIKMYLWLLVESPCIYAYGRAFIYRQRKIDEEVEGLENYDEFCSRGCFRPFTEASSVVDPTTEFPPSVFMDQFTEDHNSPINATTTLKRDFKRDHLSTLSDAGNSHFVSQKASGGANSANRVGRISMTDELASTALGKTQFAAQDSPDPLSFSRTNNLKTDKSSERENQLAKGNMKSMRPKNLAKDSIRNSSAEETIMSDHSKNASPRANASLRETRVQRDSSAERNANSTNLPVTVQQEYTSMAAILSDFSIFDVEAVVKKLVMEQIMRTGGLQYFTEDQGSKTFQRRQFNREEMNAEYFQTQCNRMRDSKIQKNCESDSDRESSSSTSDGFSDELPSDRAHTRSVSPLSATHCSGLRGLQEMADVRTCAEFAKGLAEGEMSLQFIRPRMNFSAQDEFILRFDRFVEACLFQIKEGSTIILDYEGGSHEFFCLVATLLFRGFESANGGGLEGGGSPMSSAISTLDMVEDELEEEETKRLAFLKEAHDILRQAMSQNGVDVDECVATLTSVINDYESFNLLRLISSNIKRAECEPNYRQCRALVLASIRYAELYVWLLLLQVYLSLPFTKDSLSQSAINRTPSFSSFFKSVNIRKWMDLIDPWKFRKNESPDVFHLRYTNGLRRWDSNYYICFGAIVDQIYD